MSPNPKAPADPPDAGPSTEVALRGGSVTGEGASEVSMDHKVRAWVERSGRALELRVARTVMAHGAVVRSSFPYVDPVTQIVREGDVQAEWGWQTPAASGHPCSLFAVIECKSGTGKPWVAFRPSGRQRLGVDSLRNWVACSSSPSPETMQHAVSGWIGHAPFDDTNPASHIVSAVLDAKSSRNDASDNEKNVAGDAMRQVLSQAEAVHSRYVPLTPEGEERAVFVVAAVVTAAPLFVCRLGDDGGIRLEQVDSLTVMGHGAAGDRRRVHVMRESALSRFAADLRACTRYVSAT